MTAGRHCDFDFGFDDWVSLTAHLGVTHCTPHTPAQLRAEGEARADAEAGGDRLQAEVEFVKEAKVGCRGLAALLGRGLITKSVVIYLPQSTGP